MIDGLKSKIEEMTGKKIKNLRITSINDRTNNNITRKEMEIKYNELGKGKIEKNIITQSIEKIGNSEIISYKSKEEVTWE